MKIANTMEAVMLGATKNDYVNKAGQPSTYYNVAVKQGGGVATVPCTRDIYDMYVAKQLEDYKQYRFDATYDDRFGRYEIFGAHPVK